MIASYCTAQQVASLIRFKDPDSGRRTVFSAESDPSLNEVNEWIEDAQEEIETYTGRAYRSVTITNEMYTPRGEQWLGRSHLYFTYATLIHMEHNNIKTLDTSQGDKIEYFDGDNWADLLVTGIQGDGFSEGDFWIERDRGVLYFFNNHPREDVPSVRLSYRYGESSVPRDIKKATSLLVCAVIVDSEFYVRQFPQNIQGQNLETIAESWREQAYKILERHRRFQTY